MGNVRSVPSTEAETITFRQRKTPVSGSLFFTWWRLKDSNLRPSACKADALPTELSLRVLKYINIIDWFFQLLISAHLRYNVHMYKVSNTRAITRKQRFYKALLFGIPASILLGLAYGILQSLLPVSIYYLFVLVGYLIGEVVKNFGRGVQIYFSILGAVLAVVSFIIADIYSYYGFYGFIPAHLPQSLATVFTTLFAFPNLGILFRAAGIYVAFSNSRVV